MPRQRGRRRGIRGRPPPWLPSPCKPGSRSAAALAPFTLQAWVPPTSAGDVVLDAALARAEVLGAEVLLPRHRNPPEGDGGPNHWEIWLRDLDGYKVVLSSPDGTADGNWRP